MPSSLITDSQRAQLLLVTPGTVHNIKHTTYREHLIPAEMFQYEEEFEYSLDLVTKCGAVIKSAFTKEKHVW